MHPHRFLLRNRRQYLSTAQHLYNSSYTSLIRKSAFIDGQWIDAGETFPVDNPSNARLIAHVADCSRVETQRAVQSAFDAYNNLWREQSSLIRSQVLRQWADLCMARRQDLAALLTAEQGKPLAEALAEIDYALSFLYFFADCARTARVGETIGSGDRKMLVEREPIGVAAMITPWNFPTAMITRKVGAAFAAGCCAVVKPAPDTPLSALALAVLAEQAGIPPGVLNILPASHKNSPHVGETLCHSPLVGKLSFTGSTRVGKHLLRQCADTVKKVSLELGGNAAFIVFNSADVDAAVEGALQCKFRNSGQTCISANRLLVQEEIRVEFIERFAKAVRERLRVGDGFDEANRVGPLINAAAVDKVERHVADALERGGKVVVGGKRRADLGENFFEPTVLRDVDSEALCTREETFGPVAPIVGFRDEAEAIALANSTRFGLASYFYSRDPGQIFRVARLLECGIVGVNSGLVSSAEAPFGGHKESGLGCEGSRHGIDEYLQLKYVCIGGL